MESETITYDPQALPNETEVNILQETRNLSDQLASLDGHIAGLSAQSDDDQSTGMVLIDDGQYQAIEYDLRVTNTLCILILVILGICAGLSGWRVFSSRWL